MPMNSAIHMERGDKYMIETVSENDHKVFKEKVDRLILQGYKMRCLNEVN